MPEDFHIKFSGASSYKNEGKIHIRMSEPHERVEALLPLLRQLVQSESGEIHRCPICNQDLEVSFYRFVDESNLRISAYCKNCTIIVSFDTNKMPVWAPRPITLGEALGDFLDKKQHGEDA